MTPVTFPPRAVPSVVDWNLGHSRDVLPLIDAEVHAWRDTLCWDIAGAWSVIEPARQTGQLPGRLVLDDTGRPCGWAAFLPLDSTLQVMALVASTEPATRALVESILRSTEAQACEAIAICVRDTGPMLRDVLARSGFVVDIYQYLVRDLDGLAGLADATATNGRCVLRRWHDDDAGMAALCERAYRDMDGVRAFAPRGTSAEWQHYISTLTQGTGCGWFLPELSAVAPSAGGSTIDGAIMVTDLGTRVAHIAQLAVDPAVRGRGLAGRLVDTTLLAAAAMYERISLLVSSSNAPALALYKSRNFRRHASFIVARR